MVIEVYDESLGYYYDNGYPQPQPPPPPQDYLDQYYVDQY
jgi:hypothetical protein